jgi:hypothetical protein
MQHSGIDRWWFFSLWHVHTTLCTEREYSLLHIVKPNEPSQVDRTLQYSFDCQNRRPCHKGTHSDIDSDIEKGKTSTQSLAVEQILDMMLLKNCRSTRYACEFVCVSSCVCVCLCVCVHVNLNIMMLTIFWGVVCMRACVCSCVWPYVRMYVCTYVCMYIYVYMNASEPHCRTNFAYKDPYYL